MRNLYLICAFIIVLYGLSHAVPPSAVALSWLLTAIFYFMVSLLLKNIKYRWMAISTVMAAIIHVILIDLANLAAGFRIVLLLVVSLVLILWSVFYARNKSKMNAEESSE
jgi:hypothetical protein